MKTQPRIAPSPAVIGRPKTATGTETRLEISLVETGSEIKTVTTITTGTDTVLVAAAAKSPMTATEIKKKKRMEKVVTRKKKMTEKGSRQRAGKLFLAAADTRRPELVRRAMI